MPRAGPDPIFPHPLDPSPADAARSVPRAMDSPAADGEVLNLGSGEAVSLVEFARTLIDVGGRGSVEIIPFPEEGRRIDIGSYRADLSRIRTRLGWEPRVALRDWKDDFFVGGAALNTVGQWLMRLEMALVAHLDMPVGLSLFAVARKP